MRLHHVRARPRRHLRGGLQLGGTAEDPQPLPGNKVGTLFIAKVKGSFSAKVLGARDLIYNFLTASPVWTQILTDHGMIDPTP